MKAVFYSLALLATGGAAFFSFSAKQKFEEQKDLKETKIIENKDMGDKVAKQDAALTEEKGLLETAKSDREQVRQSNDTLTATNKKLGRDLANEEGRLEEQKATFAKLKEAQEEINKSLDDIGGNVELTDIPEMMVNLENERQEKEKQLDELEKLVEAAQKNVERNQAEIGRLADRDASRDARIRRNAMESTVTAVNDDWGFVVIGAGSNTGFTPQTKLLVKRGGRLIGQVKPSSIGPSQTIAEIDKDSVAPGVRIQPGDRVILAAPATN